MLLRLPSSLFHSDFLVKIYTSSPFLQSVLQVPHHDLNCANEKFLVYKDPPFSTSKSVIQSTAPRLCAGRTVHRACRRIAVPCHDHGTRSGWGVGVTHRPLFTPGKDPVPIVQEAGWAPEPVWKGAKNLAPTGIRSSDRIARSLSLYRVRYAAHVIQCNCTMILSKLFPLRRTKTLHKYRVSVRPLSISFLCISQSDVPTYRSYAVLSLSGIPI
jgi:hypothetical protein